MTKEERMNLLRTYITAFECRELTPEWFLCFAPKGSTGKTSLIHICKPRTWETLRDCVEDGMLDARLMRLYNFTPFREHKCRTCGEELPVSLVIVGRLFILGDKL
jgi:hypothetical protein